MNNHQHIKKIRFTVSLIDLPTKPLILKTLTLYPTKILLTTVVSNKAMSNNIFTIALMGLFFQFLYGTLFSIVVTGYGPPTAKAYAPLPYILIVPSYLSYLWSSQVITNIVYTTTAGVSATHYLPHGPHGQDTPLMVLKHVLTTSFGPICCGFSVFIRSVPMFLYVCYPVVKPLAVKYAFYHVVVHELEFCKASKKVRAQLGALAEKSLLDQLMLGRLLLVNALHGALLSGAVYWEWQRVPNVHIIIAAVLSSVQIVLTAGAAADAVVDAMFVTLAQDREGFVASQEGLADIILGLSGGDQGEVELQAVEVEVRGAA
ncbi:hypothetical protein BG006_004089 [Podila minutissima]|uniref:Protein PNS1 n=1 Tax=Podila minutissima TaxID=64525 RepID=A0A9P5SP74_9FUNG|nr:hypothetical protein BG006_004089 [Podila minutissima]